MYYVYVSEPASAIPCSLRYYSLCIVCVCVVFRVFLKLCNLTFVYFKCGIRLILKNYVPMMMTLRKVETRILICFSRPHPGDRAMTQLSLSSPSSPRSESGLLSDHPSTFSWVRPSACCPPELFQSPSSDNGPPSLDHVAYPFQSPAFHDSYNVWLIIKLFRFCVVTFPQFACDNI